ncbi:MAG: alpha/beta hydrolase family protein [Ignavibacteria bacterium]
MKQTIVIFILLLFSGYSQAQENSDVRFKTEEITIPAGKFEIKGDLLTPVEGGNFPVVLFCPGSGPTDRKATIKNSKIIRKFLECGYAFFIDDKPGSGDSKGEFSGDSLLRERAQILSAEIEEIKKRPNINSDKIGLYGSSQAGYVMSLVLQQRKDISFVIAVSCPAMNSIEQSAFLVKMQALCGGRTNEDAETLKKFYIQRAKANTYSEFRVAADYLNADPVIADLGWGYDVAESEFVPEQPDSESFINPLDGLGKIKIPALFIFGDKDTQIDPVQGAEMFGKYLKDSGNENFKIVTVPGVDHNMRLSKTGSLKEQNENYKKEGGAVLSPDFLKEIETWLGKIK